MFRQIPVPTAAQLGSESMNLRTAVDAELRRLGWHWKHPRIQNWLQRLSQASGRTITMTCDMTDADLAALLHNLQDIPKQLELGGEDAQT